MVSYSAWRCGTVSGTKGGAMIGCTGTMYVVQWCDVMVRVWCDGTVQWCDGTVQWCAGMVQWCDGAVQCTSVPQCTHCTAPKRLLPKRFFSTKTCVFADFKNVFFAKNGAVEQAQWYSGLVPLVQWYTASRYVPLHRTAPHHRTVAPRHCTLTPHHRTAWLHPVYQVTCTSEKYVSYYLGDSHKSMALEFR